MQTLNRAAQSHGMHYFCDTYSAWISKTSCSREFPQSGKVKVLMKERGYTDLGWVSHLASFNWMGWPQAGVGGVHDTHANMQRLCSMLH